MSHLWVSGSPDMYYLSSLIDRLLQHTPLALKVKICISITAAQGLSIQCFLQGLECYTSVSYAVSCFFDSL